MLASDLFLLMAKSLILKWILKIFKKHFTTACDGMVHWENNSLNILLLILPGRDIANVNKCWVKVLFVSHMTSNLPKITCKQLRQLYAFAKISLQLCHSNSNIIVFCTNFENNSFCQFLSRFIRLVCVHWSFKLESG